MHHGLELTVLFWVISVLQQKVYKIFPFKITKAFFSKIFYFSLMQITEMEVPTCGHQMIIQLSAWGSEMVLPRTLWEQTDGPGIPRTGAPSSCCLHSGRRCRACAALSQPSTTCLWSDLGGREKNPECNKRDAEITRAEINRRVYRLDEKSRSPTVPQRAWKERSDAQLYRDVLTDEMRGGNQRLKSTERNEPYRGTDKKWLKGEK